MNLQPKYMFDHSRLDILPMEYRESKLEDVDTEEKKSIFINAMDGESFYLYGSAGTGKSFIAFLVAKYMTGKYEDIPGAIKSHRGVVCVSYPGVMMQLENFTQKSDAFQLLDYAKRANFLLIDEFYPKGLNESMFRATYDLINERINSRRQTIITSNYSLNEVDSLINLNISSRIIGMSKIIDLSGKDRRLGKQRSKAINKLN